MDVASLQRTGAGIQEMGDLLKSIADARINSDQKTLGYSLALRVENEAMGNTIDLLA